MSNDILVIERLLDAPVARVWQAITSADQLRNWQMQVSEFSAEPGFAFRFIVSQGVTSYLVLCEVQEVVVHKKLSYSWRYEGFSGNSLVCFELFPAGQSTRLVLTHSGLDTLPVSHPGFLNGQFIPDWVTWISGIIHT